MKILTVTLTMLLASGCIHRATSTVADAGSKALLSHIDAQLSQILATWHANSGFPGASLSYILPDGSSSNVSIGFADLEKSIPMEMQRMLGASTGKMFAAACALKLIEQNKIKLDEPIAKWFAEESWFPRLPNSQGLTLRTLLNHTSGLPNHNEMPEFLAAFRTLSPNTYLKPMDLIKFVLDKAPVGKVGEKFAYSDTNYILVGLIIERASARNYYDIAAELLAKIALHNTVPSDNRYIEDLAAGYTSSNSSSTYNVPQKVAQDGLLAYHPGTEWTGGGFATTSYDLAKWVFDFHQGKILSPALTQEARVGVPYTGEQNSLVPEVSGYGLGVMVFKDNGLGQAFGHPGNTLGYRSLALYFPSSHFSMALMVNSDDKDKIKPGFKDFLKSAEKVIADAIASN